MRSITTSQFWKLYHTLSEDVQHRADKAYALWQIDPQGHGLNFKRVSRTRPVYSVRIGLDYRAVGLLDGDTIIWFWIGPHDEYERLLKQM